MYEKCISHSHSLPGISCTMTGQLRHTRNMEDAARFGLPFIFPRETYDPFTRTLASPSYRSANHRSSVTVLTAGSFSTLARRPRGGVLLLLLLSSASWSSNEAASWIAVLLGTTVLRCLPLRLPLHTGAASGTILVDHTTSLRHDGKRGVSSQVHEGTPESGRYPVRCTRRHKACQPLRRRTALANVHDASALDLSSIWRFSHGGQFTWLCFA